jgi:hypothetical protein
MKAIHWTTAAVAFVFAEPVQAGINDPEVIIYRFSGVRDDGGVTNAGVATVFHCTNFSGQLENIRLVTRDTIGALRSNNLLPVDHLHTLTVMTHRPLAYPGGANVATGGIVQGTAAIAATSINIICTAETIDASTAAPVGVARHGIRFSPIPGTQE